MPIMTRRRFLQSSTLVPAVLCLPGVSRANTKGPQYYTKSTELSIIHQYPKVPLVLDGTPVQNPEELAAYNNTPLYYTPFEQDSKTMLAAFTSRDKMLASSSATLEPICTSNPNSLPTEARFYQHINGQGAILTLPAGYGYTDLTRVWMLFSNWNDQISSVDWCRWDVTLFEHINYGGSQLRLRAGCTSTNLVSFGWNDKASSLINWGRRF